MGLDQLRGVLKEKEARGVKQVRVTSVLAALDEAERETATTKRKTNGGAKSRTITVKRADIVGHNAKGKPIYGPGDLVGSQEAAELLGVDKTRPSKWRINGTTFGPDKVPFPEPVSEVSTGPIFLRSEVEALRPFVEERRRNRN